MACFHSTVVLNTIVTHHQKQILIEITPSPNVYNCIKTCRWVGGHFSYT